MMPNIHGEAFGVSVAHMARHSQPLKRKDALRGLEGGDIDRDFCAGSEVL